MKQSLFLFTVLCLFFSCQKEKEIADPMVIYLGPNEETGYQLPDSVHVVADVTAYEAITSIEVCLTNEALIPVMPTIRYQYSQGEMSVHLDLFYSIDEIRLESGKYFMLIIVKTPNSEKNKYRAINLITTPRVCQGTLLIQKANVNTSRLSLADCAGNVQELGLFPVDYGFSACSSWDRTFYLGGRYVGDFYAFDTDNKEIRFSIVGFSAATPSCIQGITAAKTEVLLSGSDGILRTYSYAGKLNSSVTLAYPQYPAVTYADAQYFYVNVLTKSGPEAWLNMYYYPWGSLFASKQINFRVMAMYAPSPGTLLLFGNDAGGPRVVSFDVATQTFSQHLSNLSERITAVCRVDDDNYYFSTSSGIRWYRYDSQTSISYSFGGDAVALAYEDLSNRLVLARPMSLETYFLTPYPGLINTLPMTDSLAGIELLYNK